MKKKTVITTRKYEVWVIRQFSTQSNEPEPPMSETDPGTSLERWEQVTESQASPEETHKDETAQKQSITIVP